MSDPGETDYRNPGDCENCGDETPVIWDEERGEWLCKPCTLNEPPSPGNRTVYQATMNGET